MSSNGHAAAAVLAPSDVAELRAKAEVRLGERRSQRERETGARLSELEVHRLARDVMDGVINEHASDRHTRGVAQLDKAAEDGIRTYIFDWVFGLGPFQPIVARGDVVNVHVAGTGPVFVDLVDGSKETLAPIFGDPDELTGWVRRQASSVGRRFDISHPYVSFRLSGGSRLSAIGWVSRQPEVWIRCHHFVCPRLDDLVATQQPMLTRDVAHFLRSAVLAGMNILVSGGQNTGKTTLLRALANEIPPEERIVTVESSFELDLDRFPDRHPDMTALEAREKNAEGVGEVTSSELLTRAMRMAATRIILGEALDEGVIPLLKAMNAGASAMATVHANSADEAFTRLAVLAMDAGGAALSAQTTLYMAATAVDLSVGLTRLPSGRRVVCSIREVVRSNGEGVDTSEVFAPDASGEAVRTAVALREGTRARLARVGYHEGISGGSR